ncbi:MAG: hypothetical protein FJ125_08200, partial [Deltaproteobacteria bacterium]|nr:hypothetical protein [Deltaproteobacteria bacterium]
MSAPGSVHLVAPSSGCRPLSSRSVSAPLLLPPLLSLLLLLLLLPGAAAPAQPLPGPEPEALGDLAPPGVPDGRVDGRDVEVLLELILAGDQLDEQSLGRGDLAPAAMAGPPDEVPLRLSPNPVPAWPLDVGDAVLVARRAAGDVVFSARNRAPQVTLAGDGDIVPRALYILAGRVSDDGELQRVQVQLLRDGRPEGGPPVVAPDGSFRAEVRLAEGDNTISAFAVDALGRRGPEAAPVLVTFDPWPPELILLSPEEGAAVSAAEVEVIGEVRDEVGVLAVRVGGEEAMLLDERFGVTVSLAPGLNLLELVAEDLAGNLSEPLLLTVVRDEQPPAVAFDPPPSTVNRATVLLTGTATDGWGIARVEVGGRAVELDAASGTFTVEVEVAEGTNRFVALAVDRAGNRSESEPVLVVGDFTAPQVWLSSPPVVAESPAAVTLAFDEPALLLSFAGRELPPAPPELQAVVPGVALAVGVNRLSFRVQDPAGNTTTGE